MTRLGVSIALAGAVLFGIYPPAARAVYEDGGNAVFLILATTLVRATGLALFCMSFRKKLFVSSQNRWEAGIGGFFQAASVLAIFSALAFLPGPLVIVIVFTHTLMLLFFMAWRGEIQLDALTVAAACVALGGLFLVLDVPGHLAPEHEAQAQDFLIGIGLSFVAAIATAVRMYFFGRFVVARDPAVVGAESFVIAALLLLLILSLKMPEFPETAIGYFWSAAACLSLLLGSFCMFYGIKELGAFRFSLFLKLEPVFNAVFSVWFLNEILKGSQYAGMALVIATLALYQYTEHKRKAVVI